MCGNGWGDMAKVGAQRASELTGRSKSTIQRAMNCGKLSFEVDSSNRRLIDISELERAFGLKPIGNDEDKNKEESGPLSEEEEMRKAEEIIETERLKMRVKMLEEQLDTAREQLADLKEQRDLWQKQAQQVLLTSQYSQKQAEELKEELEERKRREAERRQQVIEQRMKKLSGAHQNQNRQDTSAIHATTEEASHSEETDLQEESRGKELLSDLRDLWQKIREKVA